MDYFVCNNCGKTIKMSDKQKALVLNGYEITKLQCGPCYFGQSSKNKKTRVKTKQKRAKTGDFNKLFFETFGLDQSDYIEKLPNEKWLQDLTDKKLQENKIHSHILKLVLYYQKDPYRMKWQREQIELNRILDAKYKEHEHKLEEELKELKFEDEFKWVKTSGQELSDDCWLELDHEHLKIKNLICKVISINLKSNKFVWETNDKIYESKVYEDENCSWVPCTDYGGIPKRYESRYIYCGILPKKIYSDNKSDNLNELDFLVDMNAESVTQ